MGPVLAIRALRAAAPRVSIAVASLWLGNPASASPDVPMALAGARPIPVSLAAQRGENSRHAWTASVNGPVLHGKGQRAVSAPIEPIGYLPQAEGVITTVRWSYGFAGTPPLNLQAHLCNATRCVLLTSAQGQTDAFSGDDPSKGFVFAFRVPGQGGMERALRGKTNRVTVSYR